MPDNSEFCEQIGQAILELGTKEAASCMARALIAMATKVGTDVEFNCELGQVLVLPSKAESPPIIF